jgi:hypothetical protein
MLLLILTQSQLSQKPPNTTPINAPLVLVLLAVDCPGKVGVVVRGSIGIATATGGFVGGMVSTSVGRKVGNSDELVVFIITIGEGVIGEFVIGTGTANTYRV